VLVEFGRTRVLCCATVEERRPPWLTQSGQTHGWVTAEYRLLPRSTQIRTPRETHSPGGRTMEIQRLIGRSLRAAIDLNALGERQIIVDCDVLQADGGTRTASITGGFVALALAVQKLAATGDVPTGALRQPVAAVSVGLVQGETMLDLCYHEDSQADVDLNVVMTADGRLVDVQGSAEREPFSHATLDVLLRLAHQGIERLYVLQREALEI